MKMTMKQKIRAIHLYLWLWDEMIRRGWNPYK